MAQAQAGARAGAATCCDVAQDEEGEEEGEEEGGGGGEQVAAAAAAAAGTAPALSAGSAAALSAAAAAAADGDDVVVSEWRSRRRRPRPGSLSDPGGTPRPRLRRPGPDLAWADAPPKHLLGQIFAAAGRPPGQGWSADEKVRVFARRALSAPTLAKFPVVSECESTFLSSRPALAPGAPEEGGGKGRVFARMESPRRPPGAEAGTSPCESSWKDAPLGGPAGATRWGGKTAKT
eukprot:scaffold1318_cov388-Prasinococcus_capsulatus_cf.AAC.58